MQNQESTNFVYAGFFVRLAAFFVDILLVGIVLLAVKTPLWIISIFQPDNILQRPLIFRFSAADILIYVIGAAYFIIMTYLSGATLGKKLFHLKVIQAGADRLTLINVVYRETIGRYLSTVILWIGYFLIGADAEKKALHDILCDTRVIYDFPGSGQKNKTDVRPRELVVPVEDSGYQQLSLELTESLEIPETLDAPEISETSDAPEIPVSPEEKKYPAADYGLKKE